MNGVVPRWAHEKAEVHVHDRRWSETGRIECSRLAQLMGPWLVDGVEHIGSTAVRRLAAKPIIDLMASVTDPDVVVDEASERLAVDGWCYVSPELDHRPWRRFFVKPDSTGQRRIAHLHVIPAGHARWSEQITFRDVLRHDDRLARKYEDLKRRLADQHGHDREAYTNAKAEFIAEVLRRGAKPSAG